MKEGEQTDFIEGIRHILRARHGVAGGFMTVRQGVGIYGVRRSRSPGAHSSMASYTRRGKPSSRYCRRDWISGGAVEIDQQRPDDTPELNDNLP